MPSHIWSKAAARSLLVGLSLSSGALALADVKIVSHINSSMMGQNRPPVSVTTYYKGDYMRSDVRDITTIFDSKSGKAMIVDAKRKEYAELGDDSSSQMTITAKASVSTTTDHKTIAGHDANRYRASIQMVISQQGMTQNMDMQMDMWAATDLKTPFEPAHLVQSLAGMLRGADIQGMEDFTKEMSKVSGFPLEQLITVTVAGMPTGATSGPMMTFDSVADSIDESPLADSLFQVPSDYKKVKSSDIQKGMGN